MNELLEKPSKKSTIKGTCPLSGGGGQPLSRIFNMSSIIFFIKTIFLYCLSTKKGEES